MKQWILIISLLVCLELAFSKSTEKIYRKKLTILKKKPIINNKSAKTQQQQHKTVDALDAFKQLPADDLEFIKELDQQFQLHGDKIKIKIERANTTTIKNSKRTIDGDLGYGYHQNSHQNHHRYHFSRPKYMIYPYSQEDIPPYPHRQHQHSAQYHGSNNYGRTSVTIEPSRGFEIKEIHNNYENSYHSNQHPQQQLFMPVYHHESVQSPNNYIKYHQQDEQQSGLPQHSYVEPVIVLRIPGPTKYAAHLQALLQQYLEIRAAQFIKELQESEQQQHQQHQHNDDDGDDQSAVAPLQEQSLPEYHHQVPQYEEVQQQQQQQAHDHHHQQQYQEIEQVYENVKQQHQQQQQQQQPQSETDHYQIEYETQTANNPDYVQGHHDHLHQQHQPSIVETPSGSPAPPHAHYLYQTQTNHHEQQPSTLPLAMSYQYIQEPIYMPIPHHQHYMPHSLYGPPPITTQGYLPPPPPQQPVAPIEETELPLPPPPRKGYPIHSDHLQISENNPRHTHTKVIFTDGQNTDNSNSYTLPSITPAPRKYEPALTEQYTTNHHQHQQQEYEEESGGQSEYQHNHHNEETASPSTDTTIQITQRSPYNYHAHGVRQTLNQFKNKKRMTNTNTADQYRKLNKLIGRLRKKDEESSSIVETTSALTQKS